MGGSYPDRHDVAYLKELINKGDFYVIYDKDKNVLCAINCSFEDNVVLRYWLENDFDAIDDCLYIKHFVKDLDCKVKNVGAKLLRLTIKEFPNAKVVRAWCIYNETNKSLLNYYNDLGFKTIKIIDKPGQSVKALIELEV